MVYAKLQHPRSGEWYAVEYDDDDQIIRAAGPLLAPDELDDPILVGWYLDNQDEEESAEDAAWLTSELAR